MVKDCLSGLRLTVATTIASASRLIADVQLDDGFPSELVSKQRIGHYLAPWAEADNRRPP